MTCYIATEDSYYLPETFRFTRHEAIRMLERATGREWEKLRRETVGKSRNRLRYGVVKVRMEEIVPEPIR